MLELFVSCFFKQLKREGCSAFFCLASVLQCIRSHPPSFRLSFLLLSNSAVCRIGREGHVPKILLPVLRRHHNPNPACIYFPVLLAELVPSRAQGCKRRSISERRDPYELCEIDPGASERLRTLLIFVKYTVHKIDFDIEMPHHYQSIIRQTKKAAEYPGIGTQPSPSIHPSLHPLIDPANPSRAAQQLQLRRKLRRRKLHRCENFSSHHHGPCAMTENRRGTCSCRRQDPSPFHFSQ